MGDSGEPAENVRQESEFSGPPGVGQMARPTRRRRCVRKVPFPTQQKDEGCGIVTKCRGLWGKAALTGQQAPLSPGAPPAWEGSRLCVWPRTAPLAEWLGPRTGLWGGPVTGNIALRVGDT